jgi:antitoxin Phd
MFINANAIISMTATNQNFSQATRLVEEQGVAFILKNNKPRFVLLPFDEYDKLKSVSELFTGDEG